MRKFCETMCMMHGWTPHVAIGQQALIRCTPALACSPPSLVRLGWVLSTHTPSGGTWVMHPGGIGLVCMILHARVPLLAQSLAHICAGLLGQAGCLQSPILSFPSRFLSPGDWCNSGWGPMTCQLSRAAWHGLQSRDICDGALCAPGMLLGMRGILCLSAHSLMIAALSMLIYCKMPVIPCAT